MKKLLSIALAAGSMAALADTTITGQAIGSTTISSSLTNTIVAVSYKELGPTDQNISVSNIVGVANLTPGDKVYLLTDGGTYESWTLTEGSGYNYWEKNVANIVMSSQGPLEPTAGASANDTRPPIGMGIWLQRGSNWEGTPFTFYIYGATVSTYGDTTIPHGTKKLFGNPTGSDKAPSISGMAQGDRILIPTDGAPQMITYGKKGWAYVDGTSVVTGSIPAIPAGTGAWYVSYGSSDVTISWN